MYSKSLFACIVISFALANAKPQVYYKPISSPAPSPLPLPPPGPVYGPYAPPPPPPPPPGPVYRPFASLPPPPPPPTRPVFRPFAPPPPPPSPVYSPYVPPPSSPANYAYAYSVVDAESGVDISADEQADNGAVAGSYKVALPDGRIKTVTYTVQGDSGFVADVQYEAGSAPLPAPAPNPTYVPNSS